MDSRIKYCMYCGKHISVDALFCPYCGRKVTYQQDYNKFQDVADDKNSWGLNILSFFLPLVGLILYLVNIDKMPVKAKGVGISALIGFIINLILISL